MDNELKHFLKECHNVSLFPIAETVRIESFRKGFCLILFEHSPDFAMSFS